ncbi:hypothetical protein ABES02_01830 [Neobacillus pocheonensis]|uniref:hypothetical protein n=1 Tax=Neobacillus pocheonensis TaxID=363869 RepID=UPI003D26FF9B
MAKLSLFLYIHPIVCALAALLADYNYLPTLMQQKVQLLSQIEIDFLSELLKDTKKEWRIQNNDDL